MCEEVGKFKTNTNVQQSPCNLLQVLVNYGIVADCGESATKRFNFILTTEDYFQDNV
jgi:hypothetical protein